MNLLIVITVTSELFSVGCAVGFWRSRAFLAKRLVWAPVWLVPVSSPVFYGGMFALPSVRPEGLRSTVEWDEPRHGAGPSDSLSVAGWFAPLKSLR